MAVIGVAAVASVAPYEHAGALVRAHGESGWTGWHGAHDHISHQPVIVTEVRGRREGATFGSDVSSYRTASCRPRSRGSLRLSKSSQPDTRTMITYSRRKDMDRDHALTHHGL